MPNAKIIHLASLPKKHSLDAEHFLDVDIPITRLVNHILKWNGSKWINAFATLNLLSDVDIGAPLEGEVLTYEQASSNWKNKAPSGGGITPILILSVIDSKTSSGFCATSVLSGSGGTLSGAGLYYRVQGEVSGIIPLEKYEQRRFFCKYAFRIRATINEIRVNQRYTQSGVVDWSGGTYPYIQFRIQKVNPTGTRTQIFNGANINMTTSLALKTQNVNVDVDENDLLELDVKMYCKFSSDIGESGTVNMYAYSPRLKLTAKA